MSGLFRTWDKLISASLFANNNHKFLVKFCNSRLSAAAYYYDPTVRVQGLSKSHSYDLYTLSQCSYNLVKQNEKYHRILKETTSDQKYQKFQQELNHEIQLNQFAIDQYLKEIRLQVNTKQFDQSAESLANTLYSLTFSGKQNDAIQFIEQSFQTLSDKLQYASSQNLIDLVVSLEKLQHFSNTNLWKTLLQQLKAKSFQWELESVYYHGWRLDAYERGKLQSGKSKNAYVRYWHDLKNGSETIALAKKNFKLVVDQVLFRIFYPLFHREKRIYYDFDHSDEVQEKERFFKSLQNVQQSVEGAAETLDHIKSKQQTY